MAWERARKRVDSMYEPDRECGRGAQTRSRRQIAVVVNFQTLMDTHIHEHSSYCRMLDLPDVFDVLDKGVDDPKFMIEKWWQPPHADVAVPVEREAEHAPAVLAVPTGIVRPSSEERHPKRCACDYHVLPAAIGFLFRAARCNDARA